MGAGESDLTLKAVLLAVLDSKGFEDFKQKVEQSAAVAKKSGQGAEEAGGNYDRLGRKLPNAAFAMLSREMLANAGIQGNLGGAARITTIAIEGLAMGTGAGAGMMAALGAASLLLLPILSAMRDKTEEQLKAVSDLNTFGLGQWATALEELKRKTGSLTDVQEGLLRSSRELLALEQQKRMSAMQEEISKSELLIMKRTKLGLLDVQAYLLGMNVSDSVRKQLDAYAEIDPVVGEAIAKRKALLAGLLAEGKAREEGKGGIGETIEFYNREQEAVRATADALAQAQKAEQDAAIARASALRVGIDSRREEMESALADEIVAMRQAGNTEIEIDGYTQRRRREITLALAAETNSALLAQDRATRDARRAVFESELANSKRKMRDARIDETVIARYAKAQEAKYAVDEANLELALIARLKRAAEAAFADRQQQIAEGLRKNREAAEGIVAIQADLNAETNRLEAQGAGRAKKRHDATRKLIRQETDEQIALLEKRHATEEQIRQARENGERRLADFEWQIAVERAEQVAMIGNTVVAAAEMAFGRSKATAIASAIINTYEGATKALAQGGIYGAILAAAVIAFGLAQVNKIRTSNPEKGGFDDPANDAIVAKAFQQFGRKWASDMTALAVSNARGGFGEGMRGFGGGGMRGGTVIHQSTRIDRGTHIGTANFNGLLGTPNQALLDLERRQILTRRRENRTKRRF